MDTYAYLYNDLVYVFHFFILHFYSITFQFFFDYISFHSFTFTS